MRLMPSSNRIGIDLEVGLTFTVQRRGGTSLRTAFAEETRNGPGRTGGDHGAVRRLALPGGRPGRGIRIPAPRTEPCWSKSFTRASRSAANIPPHRMTAWEVFDAELDQTICREHRRAPRPSRAEIRDHAS